MTRKNYERGINLVASPFLDSIGEKCGVIINRFLHISNAIELNLFGNYSLFKQFLMYVFSEIGGNLFVFHLLIFY